MKTSRRLPKSARVIALVLLSVVCSVILMSAGSIAKTNRLVVYSAAPTSLSEAVVALWQKKYPGVQVEMITLGTGQIFTRVQAEAANPQGDIVFTGGKESFEAAIHLFEPYKVAEDSSFPPKMKHPEHKYYGFSMPLQVFIVNTKLLKLEDAPKTWRDLADPRYKGMIIMSNPALSGSAYAQMNIMRQLYGWDFVEKVVNNVVVTSSSRLVYQGVANGEYAVGITGEANVYELMKQGNPVKPIYPRDGTALRYDAVGIIKGAPNRDNARKFMDFICSKETHEAIVKLSDRRLVRPDVPTPPGLLPLDDIAFMDYDDVDAGANKEEYLNKFEEIFARKK